MASDLVETGWRLMVASCCTDVCSFSNGCGCAEKIAAALAEQSRLNEEKEAEAYRRGVEDAANYLERRAETFGLQPTGIGMRRVFEAEAAAI